jgi:hypothetical protein
VLGLVALVTGGRALVRPPERAEPSSRPGCNVSVSSSGALERAVRDLAAGWTICLQPGEYDAVSLDAHRDGLITVRGETGRPDDVRFADLDFASDARLIRVEAVRSVDRSGIQIGAGASGIELSHIHGDWVQAHAGSHDLVIERSDLRNITLSSTDHRVPGAPLWGGCEDQSTHQAPIRDVVIRGNRFHRGAFEDYIRLSNYRNVLVEGNEATGLYEDGQHMTFIQTVWGGRGLTVRRNWGHDNNANFLFIADGQTYDTVVEDNVYVRNMVNPVQPATLRTSEIYNPQGLVFRHNTLDEPGAGLYPVAIYKDAGKAPCRPELPPRDVRVEANVADLKAWDVDRGTPLPIQTRDNLFGTWTRNWVAGTATDAFRDGWAFEDAAADDWRLKQPRGRSAARTPGIDWRPAHKRYGT